MPFIDYIALEGNDIIGIWKNDESLEDLLFDLQPDGKLLQQYNQIHLPKRKKEFCITNLLVREIYGSTMIIDKNRAGKPSLRHSDYKISISHADSYSAVFLAEKQECGIDVELIDHRMPRLAQKFVSEYESLYITKGKDITYISIIWSVKEAIYKWYAKRGLDFKENMIVHPFTILQSGGPVYYEFLKDGKKITNIAYYRLFHDHVIAWVLGDKFPCMHSG